MKNEKSTKNLAEADLGRVVYLPMGYEMCDEEKQLRDGSHELFRKEDK